MRLTSVWVAALTLPMLLCGCGGGGADLDGPQGPAVLRGVIEDITDRRPPKENEINAANSRGRDYVVIGNETAVPDDFPMVLVDSETRIFKTTSDGLQEISWQDKPNEHPYREGQRVEAHLRAEEVEPDERVMGRVSRLLILE